MNPELRELIDHAKFYQGSVRAVIPLLPETDEALSELIAETMTQGDQMGFILVMTAALEVGRKVSAEHLVQGTAMANDARRLANIAWKLEGNVPGALMQALKRGGIIQEVQAGALLIIALWCAERNNGQRPEHFAAVSRTFARLAGLRNESLAYLSLMAVEVQDQGILSVFRKNYPVALAQQLLPSMKLLREGFMQIFAAPAISMVPETAPAAMSAGRTMRRAVEKHPRNEPCPCGSGQKYKRCCAGKDEERLQLSSEVAGLTHAELRAEPAIGLTAARLAVMAPFELARIELQQVPVSLLPLYAEHILGHVIENRIAEYFEVLDWNERRKSEWTYGLFLAERNQLPALAQRLIAARQRHEPIDDLRPGIPLLLARDDPAEQPRLLEAFALAMLHETDPEKLSRHAGLCHSPYPALGILICRSLIPIVPTTTANFLHKEILLARDRLNLPPEDPFDDILEKRLAEETHDEGKDATALRKSRKLLETKAAEVRHLREEVERQRRALDLREKQQRKAAESANRPAPPPADEAELREMRRKLTTLKTTLTERSEERVTLRHALQKAQEDLETLRHGQSATPANGTPTEDESAHYLPEQPTGNQPLRLIDFPPKFRENLEDLPRTAARAALAMIGRLAGGEPEAFTGVVQLKAVHGILRQRIGLEHRLLFRVLPDRIQVIDLINRRDLDRKIKTLRSLG